MTDPERRTDHRLGLAAALELSRSPHWSDRVAAGRALAAAAEVPTAEAALGRLLVDAQDTAVTQETAEALLARWDVCGLRLVLAAYQHADDESADHLQGAILNTCRQSAADIVRLDLLCRQLAGDPDPEVRAEAERLRQELR
ncbi:HEAT repeat domain-containing protein [Kitasatospora sp. LaBMicrA B282]|uniref:HEAT repeat domain-containing protein n=1 Tax=Kitasatospora sp. LaBMicrA B282 TaxID=3420949 RepID=UPI003D1459CF